MTRTLTILRDEGGVVVVDKPAGLEATGRTPDDPGGVQRHLRDRLGAPVWAAHQLDRDTTGVLVFVRKKSLVAEWQERLASARTRKVYLAITHGRPDFERRRVDAPLAYDRGARRWVVREGGKAARTDLRVLGATDEAAVIEAVLRTGRTHQARVHLAHVGCPLFGERRYRVPPSEAHPRHALHAWRLVIGAERFEAPVPPDLIDLARRIGLETALPND